MCKKVQGDLHHQALWGRRVPERREQLGVSQRHREFVSAAVLLDDHRLPTATSPGAAAAGGHTLTLCQGNKSQGFGAPGLCVFLCGFPARRRLAGGRWRGALVFFPLTGGRNSRLGLSASPRAWPAFRLHFRLVLRGLLHRVQGPPWLAFHLQASLRVGLASSFGGLFGLFGSKALPQQRFRGCR